MAKGKSQMAKVEEVAWTSVPRLRDPRLFPRLATVRAGDPGHLPFAFCHLNFELLFWGGLKYDTT
jgi:hypothetical protein